MKIKKTVGLIGMLAAVMLGAACASAADLSIRVDAPRIEVTGKMGDSAAPVSVVVLNPGVDYSGLDRAELIAGAQYVTQLTTEADGSFALAIYLDPGIPADQYTMYIQSENALVSEPFYYINKEGAGLILEKFNAAGTEDMEALLHYYSEDVPILKISLDEEYEKVKVNVHTQMLAFRDKNGGFSALEAVETIFRQAMAYEEISRAEVSSLDAVLMKYQDILGLAGDEAYAEDKQEIIRLFVLHRSQASGGNFADFDAMLSALNECRLVTRINAIDAVSEMDKYICANAAAIGISAEKYKTYQNPTIGSALIGKGFTSLPGVREAVEKRMKDLDSAKKPDPGPQHSGGGSSTGGKGISIVTNGGGQDEPEAPEETHFIDLEESGWAKVAILSLWKKGVVSGVNENEFKPNENVTREAFITMVVKAFGLEADGAECEFADVQPDAWYYHPVSVASTLGIIAGTGDGAFGVGEAITRQDMAVIIDKTVQYLQKTLPQAREYAEFGDGAQISAYAAPSVRYLYMAGVVNGMGDGFYAPLNSCTRAQAAVILNGVTELID